MGSATAQEKIKAKLNHQDHNYQKYSFENLESSYQALELGIEVDKIAHTNRNTFISINCIQDGMEMEIGRFFLPQKSIDGNSNISNGQAFIYDFDICLWQKVLLNQPEIVLKTNGSFDDADINLYIYGLEGKPAIEVKEIVPLWNSGIDGFEYGKNGISKDLLPTQKASLKSKNDPAFIQVLVHGIEKNQDPSARFYYLNVNNKEIAKRSIWRDDCAYNPFYPQSQNWYESRPNWCPGLRIYPL
jgi:hypothetical protein